MTPRRIAGMWWAPDIGEGGGLGWTLRYGGELAPSDRLVAAEVVDAYHRLVLMPRREREALIARMRRELVDLPPRTAFAAGQAWAERHWNKFPSLHRHGITRAARHWKAVLDAVGLNGDDREEREAAYRGASERWRELQAAEARR